MPIQFKPVNKRTWIAERISQSFKNKNIKYIDDLNTLLFSACKKVNSDGELLYKNGDLNQDIDGKYMFYNYGSPAPWLCKILPEGYGFTNFYPNDIYKKCQTETGIHKKLLNIYDKGLFTRYPQPKIQHPITLPENYILITMQNTGGTVWYRKNFSLIAKDIVKWSAENKRNVIFKWHNGCLDHSNPERWFRELGESSNYAFIEYKLPLSILIKNCDMMWTASSMSGIEALINNKPVSIFGVSEYMEMANVCDSPEQAVNAKVPDDLEQWLTYYVRKYCINIYANDSLERIETRLINYFERDLSVDELILL
jgi:hypothetical protein